VDAADGDKTLSISQINRIIKAVKEGKNTSDLPQSSTKKTKRTGNALASITATVENDWWITVRELAATGYRLGPSMPSSMTIWAW
jgi:hypothetical protein